MLLPLDVARVRSASLHTLSLFSLPEDWSEEGDRDRGVDFANLDWQTNRERKARLQKRLNRKTQRIPHNGASNTICCSQHDTQKAPGENLLFPKPRTTLSFGRGTNAFLRSLPLIAGAVGDGGEARVVDAVLAGEAVDVDGAHVVGAAAGVGAHEAREVAVGAGHVFVAAPVGPGQDEKLVQHPPLLPESTQPTFRCSTSSSWGTGVHISKRLCDTPKHQSKKHRRPRQKRGAQQPTPAHQPPLAPPPQTRSLLL